MKIAILFASIAYAVRSFALSEGPDLQVTGPFGEVLKSGAHSDVVAWGENSERQTTVPAGLTGVQAIAAGDSFTVVLKADGTVKALGQLWNGAGTTRAKATVPAGLSGVTAIAAGGSHILALKQNGTVTAWGSNKDGQTKIPAGLSDVIAVAAGWSHSVALKKDGSVVAWGSNDSGEANVPAGLSDVIAIAAGAYHTAALKQDGTVEVWGSNSSNQAKVPAGLSGVIAISAGWGHTVALKQNGTVVAWGYNAEGQFGVPVGLSGVTAIAAGGIHTVALKGDGTVVAWGLNHEGQINVPQGLSGVAAIGAGGSHTVVLKRDARDFGILNTTVTSQPVTFSLKNEGTSLLSVQSVSLIGGNAADFLLDKFVMASSMPAGTSTSLQVRFRPRATGTRRTTLRITSNDHGRPSTFDLQLTGTGKANTGPEISTSMLLVEATSAAGAIVNLTKQVRDEGDPTLITAFTPASGSIFPIGDTAVDATAVDGAGLRATGRFIVRVSDTTAPRVSPIDDINVPASQLDGAIVNYPDAIATDAFGLASLSYSISSGSFFPVGVTTVTVTARDTTGNISRSSFTISVAAPERKLAIYRSGQAIPEPADSNTIVTWGSGFSGQDTIPAGLSGVIAIAPGGGHNVALKADGTVEAWGDNRHGQTSIPAGLAGVIAVAAGLYHTVALKQDGAVTAWGDNRYGQTAIPAGLSGVIAIAAGSDHTVALKQDGTVTAWGDNHYGQTAIPAGLSGIVAVAAGYLHTVALKEDGTVVAWGDNRSGQITIPAGLSGVIAVAAGDLHTVALKQDGTVVAWGDNDYGQTMIPAGLTGVIAVAAGYIYTLALKQDGTVVAWGNNDHGQTTIPAGLSGVKSIAAGGWYSAALKWPTTEFKTTGRGQTMDASVKLSSEGLLDVQGLSARITGPNSDQFTLVGGALPSSLRGGENATVTVRFAPRGLGKRTAWLTITSDAPSSSPYTLKLDGTATGQEIRVESPAAVVDGSTIDMGIAPVAESHVTRTITFRNTGTGPLEDLFVKTDGRNAGEFSVSELASGSLVPGATQSFTVTFAPTVPGVRTAALHIGSKDFDESLFDLLLTGQGSALDITFADGGGGHLMRPVESIDLGTLAWGSHAERSLTIRNTSAAMLTGLRLVLEGADASAFTVVPALPSSLAPGETFSFTVRFDAILDNRRTARIRLLSEGEEEQIVNFSTVVPVARLNLTYPHGTANVHMKQVVSWGDDPYVNDQTTISTGPSAVIAVAAGEDHTVALKQDGTVVAWGSNYFGQTTIPAGLSGVIAIAAGAYHTVALKQDGTVTAWGDNYSGQTKVPAGLLGVIAIAAGAYHTLALKQDGTVTAWGDNYSGQTKVPAGLSGVMSIAAGAFHTVALKQDGTLVAWGSNNHDQSKIPAGLSGVIAIAAGGSHSVALKQDGTVAAWGYNYNGQTNVPAGLSGVVAIAAGASHSVALKQDGTVVAWGHNYSGQSTIPAGLTGVTAIAAGATHTVAVGKQALLTSPTALGTSANVTSTVFNAGTLPLNLTQVVIEGPDAALFEVMNQTPFNVPVGGSSPLTLRFTPLQPGPSKAILKIYSSDPDASPLILNIQGTCTKNFVATEAGKSGSDLVYGPLQVDAQTGLVLQRITFTNRIGVPLQGLDLTLGPLASGVRVYSSTMLYRQTGIVGVLYSRPVAVGETAQFTLAYYDANRRTGSSVQPRITATTLFEPVPRSGRVGGREVPLLSVRDTANGPLLEWNAVSNAIYVVEYSDDGGETWFSAVHRLTKSGARMMWVDRGQPETDFKPANKSTRQYQVKALP